MSTRKFVSGVLVLALALTVVAPVAAGAQSTTSAYTFAAGLKLGSRGAAVVSLQSFLEAKGVLVMPAGVAKGYFGGLTKTAVIAYQASKGLPTTGYFGPLTYAAAMADATVTTPGTTTGGTTGGDQITTPGREGVMTIETGAISANSLVREGDTNKDVLGLRVRATNSDILVQRVRVNLGTSAVLQNRVISRLSIKENGTVLASANASSVVRDGNDYIVDLSGFSRVVPAGTQRDFVIAIDVYNTVDTSYTSGSYTITVPALGVRAIDGAGIQLTGPSSSSISGTFQVQKSQITSATLTVSRLASTPSQKNIISDTDGRVDYSAGNADNTSILAFQLRSEKDRVRVRTLTASSTRASGTATNTTLWLFDAATNNVIASAVVSNGTATFSNLDLWIEKDASRSFIVRGEFTGANTTATPFTVTVPAPGTNITAENSLGESVTVSGSAVSETVNVLSKGPVFTFGTPVATYQAGVQGVSSSSLTARFPVTIKAVNSDVLASTTSAFKVVQVASNGATTAVSNVVYNNPANLTTTASNYVIPRDASVTFDVSAVLTSTGLSAGQYQLAIERIETGVAGSLVNTIYPISIAPKTGYVQLP